MSVASPRRSPRPEERIDVAATGRSSDDREARLAHAVNAIREATPDQSADHTLSRGQKVVGSAGVTTVLLLLVVATRMTLVVLVGGSTVAYLAMLAFRIDLMRRATSDIGEYTVSDEEALSVPDDELPVYTVMVPAFREPTIMQALLDGLANLDYPSRKLDVKLLLEEDDHVTIDAARRAGADVLAEVVLVPAGEPRTKPKALNYGLQMARGELITIYDAEDRPDPLQLRRAAVALRDAPAHVACLQAHLGYFNPEQNLITRWFALEYEQWFSHFLPGLAQLDAPVPLGGTSNHFRASVLREVGGWDPFNVTEDADLGLRLHRRGYRTGVLDSLTLEEANSDFVNWVKQRSRWYKGYLQTWLVHMRHPVALARELGFAQFVRFNLFVAGTPGLALLNPVFWLLTMSWFLLHPVQIQQLFPTGVYLAGLACWMAGNFAFAYQFVVISYTSPVKGMLKAALLSPIYWVMMSLAATKAFVQLIATPNFWEKTQHGLHLGAPAQHAAPTSTYGS